MLRRRTGPAGTLSLFALMLAGCGQVGTNAQPDDATANPVSPAIHTQPADQQVSEGQTATFAVSATGSAPLAYQWRRNGAAIAGAVAESYSAQANAADNGSAYSVLVSNAAGTVESDAAMLTVLPAPVAPTITSQPSNQSITAGQTATFSVTATGTDPLAYRWQKNGSDIPGATAASYTTAAATTAEDATLFAVIVSNAVGQVTSNSARLGVTAASGGAVAPTITVQPADASIKVAQSATFTVTATGTAPLTFQWTRNGAAIAGANGTSYTTPATTSADNGANFAVQISNSAGSITSRGARLTVGAAAPTISTQPTNQWVSVGQSATFTVVASGAAPLTYQWQRNGAAIAGANAASYTIGSVSSSDSGKSFAVQVSNSGGSVMSLAAVLTVTSTGPTITTQPADQTVASGSSATFTVVAAGNAPLSYQWQKNGVAIAGATAAGYTTPAETSADSGATFAVTVSNADGTIKSRAATLTVNAAGPTAPSITTQPADQAIQSGQTATFSVVATGTAPLTYQWRKNAAAIAGATAASYTTPPEATSDSGATFAVVVSNATGTATSRGAVLTVTSAPTGGVDVVTYKYDKARTGQNQNEKVLTPANVSAASFGKLRFLTTDGKVDAQPLYLAALNVGGVSHNVVFVATENDSIYAFDADNGAQLWKKSLVPAGETVGNDTCLQTSGVMATPVIDRSAGAHGTIYAVARTQSGTSYFHRLHALDVTTGAELLGGPTTITAMAPKSGGSLTFDPSQANERAALLLNNGTLYTTWTSRCDLYFYTGWIMAYSASTLQQTAVLNVAPNSTGIGPAIWMAGGGPAADAANNVYLITANGAFETALDGSGFPNMGDFGNAFLKLRLSGNTLSVADYFAPYNTVTLSGTDKDLGSGGIILLPDQTDASGTTRHIAIGAGKDGNIYLVNRDSMGHFSATGNNIWQQLTSILGNLGQFPSTGYGGIWSTPAYFNNHVYFGAVGDSLKSFSYTSAKLSTAPVAATAVKFVSPGAFPVISANGTANAIAWAHQNTNPAVLYAFDASTLAQLYSSSDAAGGRDQFGAGNKFIAPVIANGKVFVGTTNGVAVFGLLQ